MRNESRLAALTAPWAVFLGCSVEHSEPLGEAAQRAIYGADDRSQYGEIVDPDIKGWADATAALVRNEKVSCTGGECALASTPYDMVSTMSGTLPLCDDQLYVDEPISAFCTGFLVGEDLLMTAGHCIDPSIGGVTCEDFKVVFGFVVDGEGQPTTEVPDSDVYGCAEVEGALFTGVGDTDKDWALIRLDREVEGIVGGGTRTPFPVRTTGVVDDEAELTVIGHGIGLPLKVSSGGEMRENDPTRTRFYTTLDVFGGNSGSPVINEAGTVEGILVTGWGVQWAMRPGSSPACAQTVSCNETYGCAEIWSGVMRTTTVLAGATCSDGVLNGTETEIDCGGACPGCELGQDCSSATDCLSLHCESGSCGEGTCNDAEANGTESDVDCGGECSDACTARQGCFEASDCEAHLMCSYVCRPRQPGSCDDGWLSNDETDVDCGGAFCAPCGQGADCNTHADCDTNLYCNSGTCQHAAGCTNGVKSGGESDVDCGGLCGPCGSNKYCNRASDCADGLACLIGRCLALYPSTITELCTDEESSHLETDVDCGGNLCPACEALKKCKVESDCDTGLHCTLGYCRVATLAASCKNGVLDGDESDVDCGGPCGVCEAGLDCSDHVDCASNMGLGCYSGVCSQTPTGQCSDGIKNGTETAIDCGGGGCAPCAATKTCKSHRDCATSLTCAGGNVCMAVP